MGHRLTAAQIFHAGRAKADPAERAAFLEGACGGDEVLRAEVETLLKAEAETGSIVEPAQPVETEGAASSEVPGRMIGRYKLLQRIGEGGFGSVWMAEQKEPVKRRVALKIIKLGMDTKQVIARFEQERQALAMMDHPNIAKVLDAGSTEAGRPYFVMELVKGVPIVDYCETEKLDTRARLGLFIKVCNAIQHAHHKGIIHRDIKPSNVMITLHDGVPVPKVIDFGIAKATNQELTDKTLFTQHRQMIGTPAYMSPEQAEMSGLDIDTRSDVYSLGVLLYELLTGTTPFSNEELMRHGFADMMRIIRDTEPPRPSTRVSTLSRTSARTTDRRRVDARKLRLVLRGDLDWIVMKALEKDRTRRYETANGFAVDVRRYLRDEPVVAGPPSAAYKLRKFAKRHRVPIVAGAVAAATLAGSLAIAVFGFIQASRDRRVAEGEANKAAAVSAFLNDMLSSVDPDQTLGEAVTVQAILNEAASRLDQGELADEPEVRATLLTTIGKSYYALGNYNEAEVQFTEALSLFEQAMGIEHPAVASGLGNLALAQLRLGKYDEAEALYERAIAIRESTDGPRAALESTLGLAEVLKSTGRFGEAEQLYRWAVASARRQAIEGGTSELAAALGGLGLTLEAEGRYDEAIAALRESLGIYRDLHGSTHSAVAGSLSSLGAALEASSELESAELVHREALEIRRRILPQRHPSIGTSLNNLGLVLQRLGKLEEAEITQREALTIHTNNFSETHPATAAALNNLARTLMSLDRLDEALDYFDDAVDSATAALPAGHMMPAALRGNRAGCLIKLRRFEEAELELIQAHAILVQELGAEHRRTQTVVQYAVELYELWEKPRQAARWKAKLDTETPPRPRPV